MVWSVQSTHSAHSPRWLECQCSAGTQVSTGTDSVPYNASRDCCPTVSEPPQSPFFAAWHSYWAYFPSYPLCRGSVLCIGAREYCARRSAWTRIPEWEETWRLQTKLYLAKQMTGLTYYFYTVALVLVAQRYSLFERTGFETQYVATWEFCSIILRWILNS